MIGTRLKWNTDPDCQMCQPHKGMKYSGMIITQYVVSVSNDMAWSDSTTFSVVNTIMVSV